MARFYARFDHGTESALEASNGTYCTDSNNCYDKRVIGTSDTAGAAFKSALVSTRTALSAQMDAQLDYANQVGANGPIIPVDVLHHSGANLTFDNVYKTTLIPGVQWPSDPRVRPTGSILSTDGALTPTSPADTGTILYSYYSDATTAVNNAIGAIKKTDNSTPDGPNVGRVSNYPDRTLYSVWHNHGLDYFAWDDFTPGQPGIKPNGDVEFSTEIKIYGNTVHNGNVFYVLDSDWNTYSIPYTLRWNRDLSDVNTGWQYLNDAFALPVIYAYIWVYEPENTTPVVSLGPTQLSAGTTRYDWSVPVASLTSKTKYISNFSVKFRDGTLYAEHPSKISEGTTYGSNGPNYELIKIYTLDSNSPANKGLKKLTYNDGSGCWSMGTAATYYTDFAYFGLGNSGTVNSKLFSTFDHIAPTAASNDLYVDQTATSGTQYAYSVAGGVVESITTSVLVC